MPTISPFTPQVNKTVAIQASTGSNVTALPGGAGQQVRVLNAATSGTVWIGFGASTTTVSTTTDMPILASAAPEKFTVPVGSVVSYIAYTATAAAAAASLFVTQGEGF